MICQVYFSVDENGESTTGSRRVVGSAADKFIHSSSVIDDDSSVCPQGTGVSLDQGVKGTMVQSN